MENEAAERETERKLAKAKANKMEEEETEEEEEEGTNLYILPGVCINLSLSFTPIKGCKERNNG